MGKGCLPSPAMKTLTLSGELALKYLFIISCPLLEGLIIPMTQAVGESDRPGHAPHWALS